MLHADLSQPAVAWTPVLFVPFGDGRKRFGYIGLKQTQPIEPRSFAVGPDGSFWILDNGNERIAHFSNAGTFLEAIPDVGIAAADMIFVRSDLYVIQNERGVVTAVAADKPLKRIEVHDGDRRVHVSYLVSYAGILVAKLGGYLDELGTDPVGFAELGIPGTGQIVPLPGLPIRSKLSLSLGAAMSAERDQDFEIEYVGAETTQTQPVHVDLLADSGSGPEPIPAEVGPGDLVPMGSSVAMYLMISPSRLDDAARFGGGRWLLRIGRGSDPLLWERLPDPSVGDERQIRHLAVGPDGSLYLMVLQKDGVQIYRRP